MRLILAALFAIAVCAQQPAGRAEFEVVSVKPGDPNDPSSSGRGTPGTMQMRNATLATLVRNAYNLNEFQLDGGPKWIGTSRFTVDARFAAGSPREQVRAMMQTMLADRFKLEVHRETRQLKQYDLVAGKSGPKLVRVGADEPKRGASSQGPRQIKAWGAPVSTLANMLISAVGAPVADRTGLPGEYNFILEFSPLIGNQGADESLPSIFTVLQEQLGLKLEATKGPVEVLVVDRAEMPEAN